MCFASPMEKAGCVMVTYVVVFALVFFSLISAVLLHLSLGLHRPAKRSRGNIPPSPRLDDVLFR